MALLWLQQSDLKLFFAGLQGLTESCRVQITVCFRQPGVVHPNNLFDTHESPVDFELDGKAWCTIDHTQHNEVLFLAYTFGITAGVTYAVTYGLTPLCQLMSVKWLEE
jgi:hypothetical protein